MCQNPPGIHRQTHCTNLCGSGVLVPVLGSWLKRSAGHSEGICETAVGVQVCIQAPTERCLRPACCLEEHVSQIVTPGTCLQMLGVGLEHYSSKDRTWKLIVEG